MIVGKDGSISNIKVLRSISPLLDAEAIRVVKGSVYVPAEAAQNYNTSGLDYSYGPEKKENRLLTLAPND